MLEAFDSCYHPDVDSSVEFLMIGAEDLEIDMLLAAKAGNKSLMKMYEYYPGHWLIYGIFKVNEEWIDAAKRPGMFYRLLDVFEENKETMFHRTVKSGGMCSVCWDGDSGVESIFSCLLLRNMKPENLKRMMMMMRVAVHTGSTGAMFRIVEKEYS